MTRYFSGMIILTQQKMSKFWKNFSDEEPKDNEPILVYIGMNSISSEIDYPLVVQGFWKGNGMILTVDDMWRVKEDELDYWTSCSILPNPEDEKDKSR